MAGNDLLNGFQAGMQAFAPLVNATLQRKKDERDTAARMGELRLQSELQGSRDATLNQYGVTNAATQDQYRAGEATIAYNRGVTTAATENTNKVDAATALARERLQALKVQLNSADGAAINLNDHKVLAAALENKNAIAAAARKVEADKQAAQAKISAPEQELLRLGRRLHGAQRIMADTVSSPEAKAEAGLAVWAAQTKLTQDAAAVGAIIKGMEKAGNPDPYFKFMEKFSADSLGFALPTLETTPTATHGPTTKIMTDSMTGEQNLWHQEVLPDGSLRLTLVPKNGAAPAASGGIPGAFGPTKPGTGPADASKKKALPYTPVTPKF